MKTSSSPDVCLIRPPNISPATSHQGHQGAPSLGVAYLTSALVKAGYEVECIDALGLKLEQMRYLPGKSHILHGLDADEVCARINPKTKIIAVSCMFTNEWFYHQILIQKIKLAFPETPIIVGGEHISGDAENLLRDNPEILAACLGEGEHKICLLTKCILNNENLSEVPGIVYRDSQNHIVVSENTSKRIKDLDSISWPAWDYLPITSYLDRGKGIMTHNKRTIPILASRGCPFSCTFCTSPQMWSTKWKARDVNDVVSEIKLYIDKYGVEHIEFYDLTAIIKARWIKDFCLQLIEENLPITWSLPSGTRTEQIDFEVLSLLKKSGCEKIVLAVESGSESTLKRIRKRVNLKDMLNLTRCCSELGIITRINFIFGLPDQNYYEVYESIKYIFFLALAGANDVVCFNFVPYPGTELYKQLTSKNSLGHELGDSKLASHRVMTSIAKVTSYSEYIKNWQLPLVMVGSMAFFYTISFTRRPLRAIMLIARVASRKPLTTMEILLNNIFWKKTYFLRRQPPLPSNGID